MQCRYTYIINAVKRIGNILLFVDFELTGCCWFQVNKYCRNTVLLLLDWNCWLSCQWSWQTCWSTCSLLYKVQKVVLDESTWLQSILIDVSFWWLNVNPAWKSDFKLPWCLFREEIGNMTPKLNETRLLQTKLAWASIICSFYPYLCNKVINCDRNYNFYMACHSQCSYEHDCHYWISLYTSF